jgi:RimJ/RimL family protein N-acetyltransferase
VRSRWWRSRSAASSTRACCRAGSPSATARLRVTATNDNTRALRLYQRAGFRLTALRAGAVTESRKLKPGIPERGLDDIPITDELELQMDLSQ